MEITVERYAYRESGLDNVFIEKCVVHVCERCKIRMAVLPDAETSAREIARVLVLQKKRLDGQSILFIRKVMRLKAVELADILRVDRVSVSRWENNQTAIDAFNDFKLRMTAIDRVLAVPGPDESQFFKRAVCAIMQDDYDASSDVGKEQLKICCPDYERSAIDTSATLAT